MKGDKNTFAKTICEGTVNSLACLLEQGRKCKEKNIELIINEVKKEQIKSYLKVAWRKTVEFVKSDKFKKIMKVVGIVLGIGIIAFGAFFTIVLNICLQAFDLGSIGFGNWHNYWFYRLFKDIC